MNVDPEWALLFLRLRRLYGAKRRHSPAWLAASRTASAILNHAQWAEFERVQVWSGPR